MARVRCCFDIRRVMLAMVRTYQITMGRAYYKCTLGFSSTSNVTDTRIASWAAVLSGGVPCFCLSKPPVHDSFPDFFMPHSRISLTTQHAKQPPNLICRITLITGVPLATIWGLLDILLDVLFRPILSDSWTLTRVALQLP